MNAALAVSAVLNGSPATLSSIVSAEVSLDDGTTHRPMMATDGAFDETHEDVIANLPPFPTPGVLNVCVRGTDVAGQPRLR